MASPADYGIEINLHNRKIERETQMAILSTGSAGEVTEHSFVFRDQLLEEAAKLCETKADCWVDTTQLDGHGVPAPRIVFPDGFWIQYNVDPGTVEVQAKEFSLAEFRGGLKDRIDRFVYQAGANIGLEVRDYGNHIHTGLGGLVDGNLLLFRNMVVDHFDQEPIYSNFIGERDRELDAAKLRHLTEEQIEVFYRLIKDTDEGKVTSIEEFTRRMRKEVYKNHPVHGEMALKYFGLNFERVANSFYSEEEKTLEDRLIRAQRNIDQLEVMLEYKDMRYDYLLSLSDPIEPRSMADLEEIRSNPEKAAQYFYAKIEETGRSPVEFLKSFAEQFSSEGTASDKLLEHIERGDRSLVTEYKSKVKPQDLGCSRGFIEAVR